MMLLCGDDSDVDYPVSFQEVLRAILEKRVQEFGREEVAKRLGFRSLQALDYLRRGYRGGPTNRTINYVTFEHLEALAKAEGVSLEDMLKEVYIATSALETIRRAELERDRVISEARPSSRPGGQEP